MEQVLNMQGLDQIFVQISEILGIGIETIKNDGMKYILEYGKYSFANYFVLNVIIAFFVSIVVFVALTLFLQEFVDASEKTIMLIICFSMLITFVVTLFLFCLPYIVSPEMYSLNQVIKLLK